MHHVQPTAPIPSPNLLIAAALALSPARSELALIGLGLGRTFCYSRAEYPIRQERPRSKVICGGALQGSAAARLVGRARVRVSGDGDGFPFYGQASCCVGAGMGGWAAAGALVHQSSTSSWLERNLLSPDAAHRTGTPQSRHTHGDHGGSRD